MLCSKDSLQAVCKREWRVYSELAVVIVLVFVVWGLLSLPIAFYYRSQSQEQNGTKSLMLGNTNIGFDNNSKSYGSGSGTLNCLNEYTGIHCLSTLQVLTECESGTGRSTVYTSNLISDQSRAEKEIGDLFFALDVVIKPSDKCRDAVVPFLCLYMFGLCGKNSTTYHPTAADCSNIRDYICEDEWKRAADLLVLYRQPSLPNCSHLSDDGLKCDANKLKDTPCVLKCHDHFYCDNNFCKPRCDRFTWHSDSYNLISDTLMITSGCVGLICGLVVLIVFSIRYSTMMVFPTILIFYSNITLLVTGKIQKIRKGPIFVIEILTSTNNTDIVILISFMDRSALFCNSIDLLDNLESPTAFCKLSGIVASYAIIQATLWWIFHIFAIFWRVQFPFHSRYFDNTKRTRYIHVACILVALILPTIPSITVSVKGGFIMSRFPPIICVGRESDANFYSFIFPITLMYAIGTTVLLAILWRIRRHLSKPQGTSESGVRNIINFSPAERKIFIVFLYYLGTGALQLTTFSIANKHINHDTDELVSYFSCQRSGYDSTCSFDGANNPIWSLVAFVVLLLLPAINFVYTIRGSDFKKICVLCAKVRLLSKNSTITSSLPSKQVKSFTLSID